MAARIWIHQTLPGLGKMLREDLVSRGSKPGAVLRYGQRNDLVLSSHSDDRPTESRLAEDTFLLLGRNRDLKQALDASRDWFDDALAVHASMRGNRRGGPHRSSLRVVARAGRSADERHRVADLSAAFLCSKLGRRWKPVGDDADVEFWVTDIAGEFVTAMRVSDAAMRRGGKVAHHPGSLRPAAAAALVMLSAPQDDDILLDPFCGAGTILIERALWGRHQLLIGSDLDEGALGAASENIGNAHQPLRLHRWDARSLQLEDSSVNAIVTNPPFGEKVAREPDLIRRFSKESARVLTPEGRMIVLAPESGTEEELLAGAKWNVDRLLRLCVQGRWLQVLRCTRPVR